MMKKRIMGKKRMRICHFIYLKMRRKTSQNKLKAPKTRIIRIYIETEILKKLCKVITAPKVNKEQALNIQYLLHFYKEEEPLYTSNIPYR